MESLFGIEMPTFGKVLVALVVVVGLLGGIMWALRRFGAERFGGAAARGRQPRLAVIDQAAVDGRRRLVLIRRDNVEHLLIIGGPTDVVVEQNIVRAQGAPRDAARDMPRDAPREMLRETPPLRATPLSDSLIRPVPLGEGTIWPLQPQSDPISRPPRAPAEDPVLWTPEPPQPPLRPAPIFAGLAEELSSRPMTQQDFSLSEGRAAAPAETARPPFPQPAPTITPPMAPSAAPAGADPNLTDMAHRLEAALRGPSEARRGADDSANTESMSSAAKPEIKSSETKPETKSSATEAKPAQGEAKPVQSKSMYDSLEQEMASLLGRPPGKT
jgi:flagellar biogenesis protein FliO